MSFDLYTDELGKKVDALPLTTTIAPGIFDNFFTGTGQAAMQGFAKTARAASRLAAIPSIAVDKVMGGTTLQDSYFATSDPIFQGAVDYWTPKPNEVGVAAEVAGSLISQLPLMLGAPSLAVASAQMSGAEDVITAPGVTSGQALAVGAAQGLGLGLGIWAPPALGYDVLSKAATGAGVNWLQGVLTRGASSAILGDNPVAKNYEPFGAKDQAIDVLLGLVFGAASHYVPSWKAEAEARTDQINVPGQRAIAKEMGQTTAFDLGVAAARVNKGFADDRAARLKEWADSATPTQKAGLAVARLAHHMQVDSAPGRATSPVATNDHVMRLREAIDSLVRDGIVPPETTVPRETLDQFATRAGEEIGGVSHLTGIVARLQRAYIEQGPEAGRAMLEDEAANAPSSSGFETQVATPGFLDELHGELVSRADEFKEKQAPAFVPDPEREAFASEQTRAMQEAATRIAREEGLPEGPTILQPIRDQLKAHLTETGFRQADGTLRKMTPEEASQYMKDHAALDEVNLRAMAAMTGGKMTPEQLLHRYLADVKMRAPAPAGALEQRITPAQHIADYKPTVETSQYGGTRYRNQYLELGNSTATNSKGQKGERRSFEIMDKSGGRAATVGFVIVEIDSKGKFAALRNIEIRKDVRTKGLGENVVATLVAHNGRGYQMDVVDITHGGHVGTDGDALPFWKKMGTQLKNYSRDPNVQMDGMLSLEDYLGARSGQGLAEGRRGSAAQAVPANRAGAGTAGSGMSRSGPTAADRAELARLNSLFQGSARALATTRPFRDWFGNSKAVDADGNPLMLYHGTADSFDTFQHDHPNAKDLGWLGRGFYFTNQPDLAGSYTNLKAGSTPNIMPVYLRIENPYHATLQDKEMLMLATGRGENDAPAKWAADLQAKGHDGVILDYGMTDGTKEYVVFTPNQVKSATGNNGDFSRQEESILLQRAGHMSPHTFSRFDHSHMSKGEGAQVYGWGTYLFTKKEVGDWYYNNFQRKAEQEASITLVDKDHANEWIDNNVKSTIVPAAKLYIEKRAEGLDRTAAANEALAVWDKVWESTHPADDTEYMAQRLSFHGALQHLDNLATKTLTSRDDPAYKTPDGQVVHVSQSGQKGHLAKAIGQVQYEGYNRAALTFDNLITHAEAHAESVKRQNDQLRAEVHEQQAADFEAIEDGPSGWGLVDAKAKRYQIIQISAPTRKPAVVVEKEFKRGQWDVRDPDTNYSLTGGTPLTKFEAEAIADSYNSEPDRTGRYDAGSELAETPEEAIQKHRETLQRALDGYDALDASAQDRVDEMKRARALVDEITEQPTPVPIKVLGGPAGEFSYLIPENTGGTVVKISHSTPKASWEYVRLDGGGMAGPRRQGFQTKEEALAHAVGQSRTLKPGYEIVKPTPKPVRKYTVEAPENDVLLNWEISAGEQPVKVREALEQQGVIIADEGELLATAEQAREMDEMGIETDESLTDDEKQADLLALPYANSSYYRERAIEFLQDMLADDARLVLDPQTSGRDVYVEIMKMLGYDPARHGTRLDGKNTKYAAAASKMLAEAGIPGHRYYDGNSRSGRKRDQTYNFVIYDENAIDIVHMEQDQTRGYLNIGDDRKMTMGFLQSSDPSTPIHERAHFFLEMLDDLSKEFPAAEAEMQVLFKEWSLDRATWDTMTLDDKRFYHEQFARSWEAYLMSNKAPTPELRSVFRRFRDWLIAIYESAQTLNVKVSTEMRELFDRLHGSQQLDPSTDPAAKAAASGPPPPPQPGVESQPPPGTVDPFADMPVEPKPFVARTLDDQDMREHLRYMVDNEVGWAQLGGKNLGGINGVPNFSTWIPRAEWWTQRPENIKKLKEGEYEAAVAKALVGDKLKPIEQRAVDFMMHVANERMQAEQAIGRDEWNNIAKDLVETDLEPTTKNVVDADAVAIANQIDEGMVERLAIQYDADDAGFMAEIRRMIDDHQNPKAAAGSQEAVGQAPEGVSTARPAAEPGTKASAKAAGSDGVDLLAQEADRFVLDNPTLTLEFEMPDGSIQKMTAAEYLADVRESAAMARDDIKLIHEAAQCLLGAS